MKLTDTVCRNAKPEAKAYKRFDGGGLYLEVTPSGGKLWRVKYRYLGVERRLSLGSYPHVSLAGARAGREEIKRLLAEEIDPAVARRERRSDMVRDSHNTFQAIAIEWMENQKDRWSAGYYQKILRCLEVNAFSHIGRRPLSQIRT
jgi:hypothetical protein